MLLSELIEGLPLVRLPRGGVAGDREIAGVTDDSRAVEAGWLFVARDAAYIKDAVERGAVAVVTPPGRPDTPGLERVLEVEVDKAPHTYAGLSIGQELCGRLAERFYGHPGRKLKLIGITGTNGKTTTAYLIQHLLGTAGVKCGLLSTVEVDDGKDRRPSELTTPGAIELTRTLARMVEHGCEAAVMECSSHALHQGRVAHLRFDAAVFTNLTGDHLDYHGDAETYAAAKAELFGLLRSGQCHLSDTATAVINADDPAGVRMLRDVPRVVRDRVQWTTLDEATWRKMLREPAGPKPAFAEIEALTATGTQVVLHGPWGERPVDLPLVGRHNVSNALQAAAAAWAVSEADPAALAEVPGVPGRLERVAAPHLHAGLPTVLVDYAHTDDALANVLRAVQPTVYEGGKLWVVFGCGGDRDRTKRPRMMRVACELADVVVVTSDNPRTEDPQAIIDDILAEAPHVNAGPRATKAPQVEPDRAAAIRLAVQGADPRDTILIAGKGHEDYQIVGTVKRRFDDREQAAAALHRRAGGGDE